MNKNKLVICCVLFITFGLMLQSCEIDEENKEVRPLNTAKQDSYVFNYNWNYEGTSYSDTLKWVRGGTSIIDIEEARAEVISFVDSLEIEYITDPRGFINIDSEYEDVLDIILLSSRVCWENNLACQEEFINEYWLTDLLLESFSFLPDFVLYGSSSIGAGFGDADYPYFLMVNAVFGDDEYVYWWVLASYAKGRSIDNNSSYKLIEYRMKR